MVWWPLFLVCRSAGLVENDHYREFVDVACSSTDGEKIIADLVNRYVEDGHYENVKGIYRWDKMTPSFPTVLKKVVVVEHRYLMDGITTKSK